MRLAATAAGIVALAAVLATPAATERTTTTPTTAPATTATTATTTTVATRKVLTIVEENHSFSEMRSGMPYLFGLAKRYGYATRWRAITHPSLPNYLAIAGGSTFGISNDKGPAAHPIAGRSVFDQALNNGKTANLYTETMPSHCHQTNTELYAVRHNPWAYFVRSRSNCLTYDVPLSQLTPRHLPNAAMIIPNLCHDAHDCPVATADGWLRHRLPRILQSGDFTTGRLTVIVTADEARRRTVGNRVLTVVMNSRLSGVVVRTRLTHFSLTRYYDQVLGAKLLRHARTAPDMKAAFGL